MYFIILFEIENLFIILYIVILFIYINVYDIYMNIIHIYYVIILFIYYIKELFSLFLTLFIFL